MRETYTGSKWSRNKLKGNFFWPGQSDGTTFDWDSPYYGMTINGPEGYIKVNLYGNGDLDRICLLNLFIRTLPSSEHLCFRTQADLMEFFELNSLLIGHNKTEQP